MKAPNIFYLELTLEKYIIVNFVYTHYYWFYGGYKDSTSYVFLRGIYFFITKLLKGFHNFILSC